MSGFKTQAKGVFAAIGLTLMSIPMAQAETLSDALISAFNHSGLLEQNRALLRAADEDVAHFSREQSKSGYWPILSLQGTASAGHALGGTPGRNNELTGKVVLSWNLFNGGITNYREKELTARLGQAKDE